jgi:hypothetical protein
MHNRLHVLEHMMLTFYKHYISFPVGANSGALEGQVVPVPIVAHIVLLMLNTRR